MDITYKYVYNGNYYNVYVNGKFYCTCDVNEMGEIEKEIREEISDA